LMATSLWFAVSRSLKIYWNYSYVMLIIKKYPDKKNHPYTPIPILIWTTNYSKGNHRLNQLSLVVRLMHL
jgi:hypothetical protein